MPKLTPDIVEAATKVFHFNAAELLPKFIVIRSQHLHMFAVTTIQQFRLQAAASETADWQIAINLSSQDLLALLGQVPTKTDEPDTSTTGTPNSEPHLSPSSPTAQAIDASSP